MATHHGSTHSLYISFIYRIEHMNPNNETHIPKHLLKKSQLRLNNTILQKNSFQQVSGNIYIQIQPHEIKLNGYQLNKVQSCQLKVINKAPIPQRVHILPPESGNFTMKVNKKGSIPSGMYETIHVNFKSSQYKYQYDVIKINTETENFVVPLYAFPTIPGIGSIFPKVIDFGEVPCKQSKSNIYPINNPIPLEFEFEFVYQKESNEISITPLKGIIGAQDACNIEIAYAPLSQVTSTADVYFTMKQFDFQPIRFRIMGSGRKPQALNQTKRVQSSKLVPLADKASKTVTLHEDSQVEDMTGTKNFKKSAIRSSYPRIFVKTKQTNIGGGQTALATNNLKNADEKEYLTRFNRVQDLDKEKEIKFCQYLGDEPMDQEEITHHQTVTSELTNFRMKTLQKVCVSRYSAQPSNSCEVEHKIVAELGVTWDDKKNNELKSRQLALQRLTKAGSSIVTKYRLLKRLKKIKQFLKGCKTRQEVAKKVEEDYLLSLDRNVNAMFTVELDFRFDMRNLTPFTFVQQFKENDQENKTLFSPEGKAQFDDLAEVPVMQAHQVDIMKYSEVVFPADFVNLTKIFPPLRKSAEQEYYERTPVLPQYEAQEPTRTYSKPLKMVTHHFIYNDYKIKSFKNYADVSENDPEYFLKDSDPLQNEYDGWSKGEYEILKAKFVRNSGVEYQIFSQHHFSGLKNDVGFLGTLGNQLPRFIQQTELDDEISDGDSDEDKEPLMPIEKVDDMLKKIQNKDVQDRRDNHPFKSVDQDIKAVIENNLKNHKLKSTTKYVGKQKDNNRLMLKKQSWVLI